MSVRDGLRNSVNLVFIRLMRDIVHHYMFLTPGSSAKLLKDADDPRRGTAGRLRELRRAQAGHQIVDPDA